ncbi:hypothetical protein C8Q80DRAFT_1093390, partial [Daedaleopsis nitida]
MPHSIHICTDCSRSLYKSKMPKFALANNLYRGELPEQFADLTWVEEMICAIYHTSAKVTRLYGSSDPSQPRIFHGNTCAHDMNVISTAELLPRTPTDVNGLLSVVFIGPQKFDPAKVGSLFRVRREKILQFLLWLKAHNVLYRDIPIELSILEDFPSDGPLPGLLERVIY